MKERGEEGWGTSTWQVAGRAREACWRASGSGESLVEGSGLAGEELWGEVVLRVAGDAFVASSFDPFATLMAAGGDGYSSSSGS